VTLQRNVDIRQVSLGFDDSGRIAGTSRQGGDHVRAGDVLATLDMRTPALQVERSDREKMY
jgi:HlyD family secretion protein